MTRSIYNPWLHRFAVLTALATLVLLCVGGLVTSHGVGMSVPDWPTTYGYNMFFFPISQWTGGIFYEHTHRLVASAVGLLTAILAGWIWARETAGVQRWLGLAAIFFTLGLMGVRTQGMFITLACVALVVLIYSVVRATRDSRPLRWWAAAAFTAVLVQGVLGGLRVTALKDEIGIFHGALAQMFFALVCAIALFTSKWWNGQTYLSPLIESRSAAVPAASSCGVPPLEETRGGTPRELAGEDARDTCKVPVEAGNAPKFAWGNSIPGGAVRRLFVVATVLIFLQLILGATMRHQHAGLSIPDFPLAYGKVWPDTSEAAVAGYNARRIEVIAAHPITAAQIWLQMAHRAVAVAILVCVGVVAWQATKCWKNPPLTPPRRGTSKRAITEAPLPGGVGGGLAHDNERRAEQNLLGFIRQLSLIWLGLIFVQAGLGAWTIWSNKAADVATAHVLVGALSLVTGVLGCIICFRRLGGTDGATAAVESSEESSGSTFQTGTATVLNQ